MFRKLTGFIWDKGNFNKNWVKHRVTNEECEEVFLDKNRQIGKDVQHSTSEPRFRLLGKTEKGRLLFVVFTKRRSKIRVISARPIKKNEERLYYK